MGFMSSIHLQTCKLGMYCVPWTYHIENILQAFSLRLLCKELIFRDSGAEGLLGAGESALTTHFPLNQDLNSRLPAHHTHLNSCALANTV